jgi:hypothetical protein
MARAPAFIFQKKLKGAGDAFIHLKYMKKEDASFA